MAAEGARSETAEEMGKVLRYPDSARHTGGDPTLPWDMGRVHTGMAALNDHFAAGGRPAPRAIRAKLETLRQQLKDANEKTKKLGHSGQFAESKISHEKAAQLAAEINQLQVRYDQYELRIANALWGEKTYAFRQAYLDALNKHYHSGSFFPVDFKNDFDDARHRINAWVEKQTHNRIKDILPPNALDEEAKKLVRLILTNAIYFKGEWAEIFPTEATKDDDFLLADGKKERVPMMAHHYMKSARYAAFRGDGTLFDTPARIQLGENDATKLYPDDSGFQMLELSYKGGEVSMILMVPRSVNGLAALEKKLNGADLHSWIGKMANRNVDVFVPRFKLETNYSMVGRAQGNGHGASVRRSSSAEWRSVRWHVGEFGPRPEIVYLGGAAQGVRGGQRKRHRGGGGHGRPHESGVCRSHQRAVHAGLQSRSAVCVSDS